MNFECWSSSQEIQDYFQQEGLQGTEEDYYALWTDFLVGVTDDEISNWKNLLFIPVGVRESSDPGQWRHYEDHDRLDQLAHPQRGRGEPPGPGRLCHT